MSDSPPAGRWMTSKVPRPLPALGDAEGARLPSSLPPVIDAHVHLFPDRMFDAIWRWFEKNAWPIRYRLYSEQVMAFLFERGVQNIIALHYAHKPGMSAALNAYVADLARREPRVIGFATAFPGEDGADQILRQAFSLGLRGVKLHCHVQAFAPDDPRAEPIYRTCAEENRPLLMHAGREPSIPEYPVDPYLLCDVDRVEEVLRAYPKLRLCIPHLGANEEKGYARLLQRYDNLWLDTTMAVSGFFPTPAEAGVIRTRPDRVMYGTDFPNLPYAWDRELKQLLALGLTETQLAGVLGGNAQAFVGTP
ncbi:MAG: amidohydrolase [Myxococcota bacterium]|nr:amidohydrolase [Myxococcota bacterium]